MENEHPKLIGEGEETLLKFPTLFPITMSGCLVLAFRARFIGFQFAFHPRERGL